MIESEISSDLRWYTLAHVRGQHNKHPSTPLEGGNRPKGKILSARALTFMPMAMLCNFRAAAHGPKHTPKYQDMLAKVIDVGNQRAASTLKEWSFEVVPDRLDSHGDIVGKNRDLDVRSGGYYETRGHASIEAKVKTVADNG